MKKLVGVIALILIALVAFSGCASSSSHDLTFTKYGMSITLNDSFLESGYETQTVYYVSKDVYISCLQELFTLKEGFEAQTLNEYATSIIKANALETKIETKDGLSYFAYSKTIGSNNMSFMAFVYKSSDSFWLMQYATTTEYMQKNQELIFKFASSVKFDK